jgi:polynucleotide 5'-triphosphatase
MNRSTTVTSPTTMDISSLVNHDGEATALPLIPRARSSLSVPHSSSPVYVPHSGPNSLSTSSPVATAPERPPTSPTRPKMPLRRRQRDDPKPIWAYLENEQLPPDLQRVLDERMAQRKQPAPQPSLAAAQAQHPPQAPPPPVNAVQPPAQRIPTTLPVNGGLGGYERPISNDAHVFDDVSRQVLNFIWAQAITNETVRNAIAESELTQLEVEARWGHIIDRNSMTRLRGFHTAETPLKPGVDVKFESTMTMEQHKRMNRFLNEQVGQSKVPEAARANIDYHHTREVDTFYALGPQEVQQLPPMIQTVIEHAGPQRVRVTRDQKTNEVIRSLIKLRVQNLDISSPATEWDYRIGINLEVTYPGPIDHLEPAAEQGKSAESMKRQKDRMSYSWMGAYQVDLTQVIQGPVKNHELELELDSGVLLEQADRARRKEKNSFEQLINGMMTNLRVLSRRMTAGLPVA